MNEQTGRVAIVSGGAYGIGRGIVRHFAARRFAVLIADLNAERGQVLEEEIGRQGGEALFVRTDVREEATVKEMVVAAIERWGRIDVLCNNAGIERYKVMDDYTVEDWQAIVHTNLRGPFLCSKYALPYLRKVKGSVVNIASVQGIACEPGISVYAATKGGVLAFTRGMALDCAKDGVRVNAICPGAINTGMMEAALTGQADPQGVADALARSIPLGRIGEPEDIAPLIYFLASADASYITGATFVVDGGLLAKLAL
jgi:NAD(P)-dependent dehydrogenase (short-subunit alcohol dehydrogenase family)